MRKLFIKCINKVIVFDSNIYKIIIENNELYKELNFNLQENLIYSIDDKIIPLDNRLLIIPNLFHIDINDTKLIKALYKKIDKLIKSKYLEDISKIEEKVLVLFEKISLDLDGYLDYNVNVDISKMLGSFSLSYKTIEYNNYFELFICYIKAYVDLCNIDIIITYGIDSVFNTKEIED